jgi:DNA-binding transcriptional LysR family regulator
LIDDLSEFRAPYGLNAQLMYPRVVVSAEDPKVLDPDRLPETLKMYRALLGPEKNALQVVVRRTALSMQRDDLVEKAIDLGISLEALMLHDNGQERDRGELRYRIAIVALPSWRQCAGPVDALQVIARGI